METMRVGVVGVGAISDVYLRNMTRDFSNLRVIGVAAKHPERAAQKAAQYGVQACSTEELLRRPDVDLIVNLTPYSAHYRVIRSALEAGKHVYTEKTITADFSAAKELCDLADKKGLYLGSAPDTFLGSSLQAARKAIDAGQIGEVTGFSASANRDTDILLSLFPFGREKGPGICLDHGCYYVTALVSLLGPVSEVAAYVRNPYPKRRNSLHDSPEYGSEFDSPNESQVSAILRLRSGITGTLNLNGDSCLHDQAHFIIYGTKGMLYLCDPSGFGGQVRLLKNAEALMDPPVSSPLADGNRFTGDCRGLGVSDMADAIALGTPNRASKQLALHVLEVLCGILNSGAEGSFFRMETSCLRPEPFYA